MGTPHKHAELIKAWADGSEIQWYDNSTREHRWKDIGNQSFDWDAPVQFRIKPSPKPDVVRWCWATAWMGESKDHDGENGSANLKIVFDGDTGKLKSAEVL